MKIIGCISMFDSLRIEKADMTERDLYGGAVNITFDYQGPAGSGGAVHTVDLDEQGTAELIAALQEALAESKADYESIMETRRALR